MARSHLSDGEISGDGEDELEAISSGEDEYFKNITNEMQKRKRELELFNELQRFYGNMISFSIILTLSNILHFKR